MKNLKNIITKIEKEAKENIVKAVWNEVEFINDTLDSAYSWALDGEYCRALRRVGDAVDAYMELIDLCKETAEQPLREHFRDALGSVKWEKFELPTDMMNAIKKARNEAANPSFKATITRVPCAGFKSFIVHDPIEQVGLWCDKIVKDLGADWDGDIPFGQKYNKPTKTLAELVQKTPRIKLYQKATVYPGGEDKIIWMSFDNMDDLQQYLHK